MDPSTVSELKLFTWLVISSNAPSWLPFLTGNSGWLYAAVATVCGLAFLAAAIRFARQADRPHARKLFFTSIIYLPVILIALDVDVSLGNW